MTKLKILIVNDFASSAFLFEKYLKSKVGTIYFQRNEVISPTKNSVYFKNNNLISQVNQIKELSKEYDLFLSMGWLASSICYLAGVNYVMYFTDAYIDPKHRVRKEKNFIKKIILSNLFKDTLTYATKVVAGSELTTGMLKKFRPDAEYILSFIDTEMFNPDVSKNNLGQNIFTFLSPNRIDPDKGQLLIWDAIKLTKSNFVVLQTDWGSGNYYEEVISKKPTKVKLIPIINRKNISSYYVSADAVLGQISPHYCGSVEREAALCATPVFCYSPLSLSSCDPFYKKSKNPKEIAQYLDKIVDDKDFRENLTKKQNEWVKLTFDNNKISLQWESVFERSKINFKTYKRKIVYKILLKIYSICRKSKKN